MSLFDDFFSPGMGHDTWTATEINPATGLPMIAGIGSVDVAGNPYGEDLDDHLRSHDSFDCSTSGFGSDPW